MNTNRSQDRCLNPRDTAHTITHGTRRETRASTLARTDAAPKVRAAQPSAPIASVYVPGTCPGV